MNLREVDLNLLVVLDVLLEERRVVTAAERLGIAQPSASAALDRCRRLFGDPLLVRAGRGMRLTARAEALRGPVRALLRGAEAVLGREQEDVAQVRRTVRLLLSDAVAAMLLPRLWARLRDTAPGIDLGLLPWREGDGVIDAFKRDRADLAVSVLHPTGAAFRRVHLLDEAYTVAMRPGHPAAEGFDLDRWLAHPHVVVSATGARRSPLDDRLAEMGRARRVGVVVPGFLMVPPLLAASDLIAMLPARLRPPGPDLLRLPPPIPVEGFPLHLAWAARAEGDVAVQHVAGLVRDLAAADPAPPGA